MTRKLLHFITILSLSCCLSACSGHTFYSQKQMENQQQISSQESINELPSENMSPNTSDFSIQESTEQTIQEKTEEQIAKASCITSYDNIEYAFDKLDASDRQVYQEIVNALLTLTAEQQVSTTDADHLNMIFQCVMNDHPEIFYVNGYQYKLYTVQNEVTKIIFEGVYTKESSEIAEAQKQIEQYVDECFSGMTQLSSTYDKVKYLYEYIIMHTEYSSQSVDSQNICSVFLDGQSVCQGYAKAMQYLCNRAGIQATLVTGFANGEGHAWNLVTIDGQNYYVDVTWGDASYVITGRESYQNNVPPITYDYLLVTTDMLEDTHRIDNVVEMPVCDDMEYNYYVKENLYFTSYDEAKIQEIFQNAIEDQNQYIRIKCSDQSVYEEIKEQLINKQKVFSYLAHVSTSVAFSENQAQLTLNFWLV